ncbi:MAG: type IV pilin protein [Rhodanobacteraceae bacterium]
MIVVVIIAVLAMIAYPSYQEQVRKTRRAQAKADLMELTQALERKFTVDRDYGTPAFVPPITRSPRDADDGKQYYDLSFSEGPGVTTYTLQAVPVNTQAADRCGTLTIDQLTLRHHSEGDDDYCNWGTP